MTKLIFVPKDDKRKYKPKRWKELSKQQKRWIIGQIIVMVLFFVYLGIVVIIEKCK